jgi:ATP-binding cassette subfamily B protein
MFPFFQQHDAMDCGPTCLRMIASFHGKEYPLSYLRDQSHLDREGVSLAGIEMAADAIGMRTMAVKIPFQSDDPDKPGLTDAPKPLIVHWNQKHFVVVYKMDKKSVWIADPAHGKRKLSYSAFKKSWIQDDDQGIALLLEPTNQFYENPEIAESKKGFAFLFQYLKPHKKLLTQLFIGLAVGSLLQLIFPFLTQALVDIGIQNQDIGFVWLILIGQLVLFGSQTVVRFIQNWITLHIGTRINVSLISDFLYQLMGLPLSYFDTKMTGDLLQRIGDHRRIESFLTSASLGVLFSTFNLILFGLILLLYNPSIFLVFFLGAVLYVAWIFIFLKKREQADYQRFQQLSDNQHAIIELIQGMPEIKLQNSEAKRRRHWTEIQAKLFRANINALGVTQYQDAGAVFISQLKDIIIIFLAAQSVIAGEMTLGMMLAVQYIVGMVNVPLQQMIGFIREAQDAKISLERLQEVHEKFDPENEEKGKVAYEQVEDKSIRFENVTFSYNALSSNALENIDLEIPEGKVTAIVGSSGSGKTTLLKLLLGFYEPVSGQIKVDKFHLKNIKQEDWRRKCGAVLQDGYIFSDSLENNITESEKDGYPINLELYQKAIQTAHIEEFISNLPLGNSTMIGAKGNGISAGQKQRILIARAVYKDPDYILFDEATNALDAHNEKIIMENLKQFFKGRTVIVVAHRLSTVKNADQIIVLEGGRIVEKGNHQSLIQAEGRYFELVKEQLEA